MDKTEEHELVTIAAELERYWSEQWRRAKEICDLLEERLASRTVVRPQLHVVTAQGTPAPAAPDRERPALKLVEP